MLGPAEMKIIWDEFDRLEAEEATQEGSRPQKSTMVNSEKFLAMMNPSKAFEALGQGRVFDPEAQSKRVQNYTDRVFRLVDLCHAETRKPVEIYLGQSEAVMKEGQKFVTEWVSTVTEVNFEFVKDVQENVKEAAKVLGLPRSARVDKAA